MLSEFEALQDRSLDYDYKVIFADDDLVMPENARFMYLRKE